MSNPDHSNPAPRAQRLSLTSQRSLDLSGSSLVTDLSCCVGQRQLHTLCLSHCESLTDITGLTECSQLKSLYLSSNSKVLDITAIAQLRELETLDISSCNGLTHLPDQLCALERSALIYIHVQA